VFLQRLGDGCPDDTVVQLLGFALDPPIAPVRVVGRHADDQRSDRLYDFGSVYSVAWTCPLRCDEPTVPTHDGVWRHDGCDAHE